LDSILSLFKSESSPKDKEKLSISHAEELGITEKDIFEKDINELKDSQLRGIEYNFSTFQKTKEAILTLGYMPNLKYIKLQQIENTQWTKILCLFLKNLNHCEDIILESKSYFLSEYPRISLGLTVPEESKSKTGFKILSNSAGLSEELHYLNVDHVSIAYNYSFLYLKDWGENEIEMDLWEYFWFIHLKGIQNKKKTTELSENSFMTSNFENLSFRISLPTHLSYCELINISIEQGFIKYLEERSVKEDRQVI